MAFVEARNLPGHIGIIMDGNGRWAHLRGQPRHSGHREGAAAVRRTVRAARRLGLRALTLYAFSEQNWARPEEEVDALMQLLREFLLTERDEILDQGIRLNAIGNLGRLPALVRAVLDPLRRDSMQNGDMTLTLALSYGGREEIAHAARELARSVAAGRIRPDDVTTEALHAQMPSLAVGDPDLVIRTGGERRISNFLLYGLAYAELHFADVLWPDFAEGDLFAAIASFQRRERRFGLVETCTPLRPRPGGAGEVPSELRPRSSGADGTSASPPTSPLESALAGLSTPITRIAI
ncbi:MAG TPA: polyprenyl diphosphate synthase [Polyangiaceae bacterium]|nr:polyprenyl diphosphate synthase [Polyangiaceae bacterium]